MTTIAGSAPPAPSNPAVLMNYLVYGAAVPDAQRCGFEAWFWIDRLGVQDLHAYPRTRVGNVLFATIELAEAAGVAYGLERARGMCRERRI